MRSKSAIENHDDFKNVDKKFQDQKDFFKINTSFVWHAESTFLLKSNGQQIYF